MTKKKELVAVNPEPIINLRDSETIEEALGIDKRRFKKLGVIMNKICKENPSKAEGIMAIANHPELTDLEKTYMGFKLYEVCLADIVSNTLAGLF
jgi:hypothetical protein